MRFLSLFFLFTLLSSLLLLQIQPVSADFNIKVTPEKSEYEPGETIKINATVIKECNVTFQIKDPKSETIFVETIKTEKKLATLEFQIDEEAEKGEYKIYVSAVSEDGKEHSSTTGNFRLEETKDDGGICSSGMLLLTILGIGGAAVAFFRFQH